MKARQIGNCTLYLGDCLDVLQSVRPSDAVITDPPYGIINRFGQQRRLRGTRVLQFAWDHAETNNTVLTAAAKFGSLASAFFIFCGASQVSHIETVLSADFTVKPAVWIKAYPPPPMPGNWWPSAFEFSLYGYKSGAWFGDADRKRRNVFYSDTYRHGIRAHEKVSHPTQKWLPLMEKIVASTAPPGGSVIDPFMGSGTTGVACVTQGRTFTGIEINPVYFEIACARIAEAHRQQSLLTPTS